MAAIMPGLRRTDFIHEFPPTSDKPHSGLKAERSAGNQRGILTYAVTCRNGKRDNLRFDYTKRCNTSD